MFAFLLRLGELCRVCNKSRFQHEDNSRVHHAATQTAVKGGERCTFSIWKYSHYFEFLSVQDENIKVRQSAVMFQKHNVKFEETFGVTRWC